MAAARKGGGRAAPVRGTPHIVVEHLPGGKTRVTDHDTKADAYKAGMMIRRAGGTSFVHSKADAQKFGLDPRTNPKKPTGVNLKGGRASGGDGGGGGGSGGGAGGGRKGGPSAVGQSGGGGGG